MIGKFIVRCAVSLILAAVAVAASAQEAKLLAVLQSDAGVEAKSAACRELARVATKQSIAPLAALLGDEKLSHMARYALETIRDPAVDDALCAALSKVQGRPRMGVIGSLGVRRTAKAVDLLTPLLKDADAATAGATARALGNIGTVPAVKALEGALAGASGANLAAVGEGLLRCAEALSAQGPSEPAREIYDRLRELKQAPPQVRAAALRGAILVRGTAGVPLLVQAIRGSDPALVAAAVRASMEMPAGEVTDALLAELPNAAPERRGLLILTLADRGDARVVPAVVEATRSNDEQLQILAIRALKRVGGAAALPALFDAALKGSADVSQAAREALAALQEKDVDPQVVTRLGQAQGNDRLVLIDLARRRHASVAADALWRAADDADSVVRKEAIGALGAVVGTADLAKLVARLVAAKEEAETAALDGAVREVCLRTGDRDAAAAQLAAVLPSASPALKTRLLSMLNNVGGAKALEVVGAAARSEDGELRDGAYRVLGQWKTSDVAPLLLELHNSVADERLKSRAIRAYLRIARQFDLPDDVRAEMCRTALKVAGRADDQRLVLEAVLRYPTAPMLAVALEAAKIPALKDEASLISAALAQSKGGRADVGKALAQASHERVKLEITKAEFGAGTQSKDVTAILRRYAKEYRVIFLPDPNYNKAFGGDPAPGKSKQLKIKYRVNGKEGEVALNENAPVVLPAPK